MSAWKQLQIPLVVSLVTTVDAAGRPNASPKTWWTPTSYEPPLMVMSLRPASDTFANVNATGVWCVHLPDARIARQVLHTAKPIPSEECELDDVGLEWEWVEHEQLQHPLPKVMGLPYWICWGTAAFESGDHVVVEGQVGLSGGYELESGVPQVLLHRGQNQFVAQGAEFDVARY